MLTTFIDIPQQRLDCRPSAITTAFVRFLRDRMDLYAAEDEALADGLEQGATNRLRLGRIRRRAESR